MKFFLFLALSIVINYNAFSQQTIDTVYKFVPGSGQNHGQSNEYFPNNAFNLPVKTASVDAPSSAELDIVSLGMKGEIIVGFKGKEIFDGPGVDFTIFENPFLSQATDKIFAEAAKIAISDDGIHFKEFPYDPKTLKGCAGKTPTNGKENPFDSKKSGGDSFDIAELGFKKITHIKITDICEIVSKDPDHPYYSPLVVLSGFDLDCVAGIHVRKETSSVDDQHEQNLVFYIENKQLTMRDDAYMNSVLYLYNIEGQLVKSLKHHTNQIDLSDQKHGVYFIRFYNKQSSKVFKIII